MERSESGSFLPSDTKQFSLRTAFFVFAWFAVFAFVLAEFGAANFYFWITIGYFFAAACFSLVLFKRSSLVLVGLVLSVFAFVYLVGPSLAVMVFAALTAATVLLSARFSGGRRFAVLGIAVAFLAALATMYAHRRIALRPIFTARRRFPIVDLSPRLASLTRPLRSHSDPELWVLLDDASATNSPSERALDLATLHNREYANFVASPGFGWQRVRRLNPNAIVELTLPELNDAERGRDWMSSLPPGDVQVDLATTARMKSKGLRLARPNTWGGDHEQVPNYWDDYWFAYNESNSQLHFHFASVQGFASRTSLGFPAGDGKAAGFSDHGFHHPPPAVQLSTGENKWARFRTAQLQLVSLMRLDSPRVYQLDGPPRMDRIRREHMPTRDLNAFEEYALKQLQESDEIVTASQGNTILMLGAVRSTERCTNCHGGDIGDLLGAFSYRFERLD